LVRRFRSEVEEGHRNSNEGEFSLVKIKQANIQVEPGNY
jgi:hypothetical protein